MRHITKAKAAIGGLSSVVVMAAALLSIVNGVWTDEERGDAPSTPTPTPYSVILPELSAGLTPPSPFATPLTQPLPTTTPTPTTPEPTVPAADSATATPLDSLPVSTATFIDDGFRQATPETPTLSPTPTPSPVPTPTATLSPIELNEKATCADSQFKLRWTMTEGESYRVFAKAIRTRQVDLGSGGRTISPYARPLPPRTTSVVWSIDVRSPESGLPDIDPGTPGVVHIAKGECTVEEKE